MLSCKCIKWVYTFEDCFTYMYNRVLVIGKNIDRIFDLRTIIIQKAIRLYIFLIDSSYILIIDLFNHA